MRVISKIGQGSNSTNKNIDSTGESKLILESVQILNSIAEVLHSCRNRYKVPIEVVPLNLLYLFTTCKLVTLLLTLSSPKKPSYLGPGEYNRVTPVLPEACIRCCDSAGTGAQ